MIKVAGCEPNGGAGRPAGKGQPSWVPHVAATNRFPLKFTKAHVVTTPQRWPLVTLLVCAIESAP